MLTQEQAAEKFLPTINGYGQIYRKKTEVLARPATDGETIDTITSDGKETSNKAMKGDYIVTNMTTAKEQYILSSEKLSKRYKLIEKYPDGTERYKAIGSCKGIQFKGAKFNLPSEIQFMASWKEPMVLKDGDMIVTTDGKEVYRIAKKEFTETYGL